MPESPEERERLDRERITGLLAAAETDYEREVLQKALDDRENRGVWLEEFFHGSRHRQAEEDRRGAS